MKVDSYIQGQPCWVELATHNWQAAKSFYQQLFGWEATDMPTPDGQYTTMQIAAGEVAAMYQMSAEMAKDTPSHWMIYFAVDNVDDTIERTKTAGGQLVIGPHNVGDAGRMAVLMDVEGASFSVWQAMSHHGIKHQHIANTLCWVELACRVPEKSQRFYQQVLGFGMSTVPMGEFDYTQWLVAEQAVGGMIAMTAEWGDIASHWMSYFDVDNCDDMANKAQALGATICVPPTDIAEVGRFAVLNDPQGAVFSIIAVDNRQDE
ncbi:VOC family protein [Shewanella intestini]|uniref:VOC family protein n=1 Tax=Shewanella intestini TaxID=2017544 RepID=A0ABS5I251_9GAMM|nr:MULTISPECIES: VOC family protein [Shewanella]MBR9728093.1 VOC family protein [Shewanella intestini]MRG36564.1 VOC family protein [Shewanella sp. XMDDZSB0408]